MSFKTYILIIFFLVLNYHFVQAQQFGSLSTNYIQIESPGLFSDSIQVDTVKKTTSIFTAGGYVYIKLNREMFTPIPVDFRAYFAQNEQAENGSTRSPNLGWQAGGSQVYLKVNSALVIEVFNRANGMVISRYYIKRKQLLPTLKLRFKHDNQRKIITATPQLGGSAEIDMDPDQTLDLALDYKNRFKNLEVTCELRNLSTKKTIYYGSLADYKPLKLDANTAYELSYSYDIQKESIAKLHVTVRPYWYQTTLFYVVLFAILLALIFFVLFTGLKKRVAISEKNQQKTEQAALRLQALLNPHFTFNALSSVQGLMNTDRITEANQYLQEFSNLLRQTLAKSQHIFNNLDQELEMMRSYIRLEALRFNFEWAIEIDENLNPSTIEIPTLLMQPLIENAIKHGISRLNEHGKLSIVCKQGEENDSFVIIVKDNGTWKQQETGVGYGLSLTKQRIQTINQMKKDQKITLHTLKDAGTQVVLTFYNWNQ